MEYQDVKKRLNAAQNLLDQPTLSFSTLQSVQSLIAGINPELDKKLAVVSRKFSKIHKLSSGQIVELSAELLPERDESENRRKKALLLLIRSIKDFRNEMTRVQKEMALNDGSFKGDVRAASRIATFAKGPLGIITAVAVITVLGIILFKKPAPPSMPLPAKRQTISYILVKGHKVTLDQVYVGTGSDCDAPHYHAKNEVSATSIDGTILPDPGGCGYGKVASLTQYNN